MNAKAIDWGVYDDADIARFITELYAEKEKRRDWKQTLLRKKHEFRRNFRQSPKRKKTRRAPRELP